MRQTWIYAKYRYQKYFQIECDVGWNCKAIYVNVNSAHSLQIKQFYQLIHTKKEKFRIAYSVVLKFKKQTGGYFFMKKKTTTEKNLRFTDNIFCQIEIIIPSLHSVLFVTYTNETLLFSNNYRWCEIWIKIYLNKNMQQIYLNKNMQRRINNALHVIF